MALDLEYSDRYGGPGAPRPDPETMCQGQCEGLGVYPDMGEPPYQLGEGAQEVKFVTCPDCKGTGKR